MDEHSPLTMVGAVCLMLVGVLLFSVRWSARRVPSASTSPKPSRRPIFLMRLIIAS